MGDSINNLKNFRSVCRSWRNSLPNPWKSLFPIRTIHHNETSLKASQSTSCHWTLLQFKRKIQADPNFILDDTYKKMELHSWNMESAYLSLSRKTGLEFWLHSVFHLHISVVILTKCQFPGTITVFSEAFLASFPSLKTLVVSEPTISSKAWKELDHVFHNQKTFSEHGILEKVFLEMEFTDDQFRKLWATFQRSLPELKQLTVKRLVESHQNYNWVEWLLKTFNNGKQTIHLEEIRNRGSVSIFCIHTAPTKIEDNSSQSTDKETNTKLTFHWTISNLNGQFDFRPQKWFPFRRNYATIEKLELTGQIFENLCFLRNFENLKLLVWKMNKEEFSFDKMSTDKKSKGYSVCGNVERLWGLKGKSVDVFVDPRITIMECNCKVDWS